jgi:hypothetical protein
MTIDDEAGCLSQNTQLLQIVTPQEKPSQLAGLIWNMERLGIIEEGSGSA